MSMLPSESRPRPLIAGAVLFAISLTLRAAHLATIRSSPFFQRLWLDLAFFDAWAARLAAGNGWGAGHFYQDPLYPYFLGSLYAVFGHSPVAAIAIQLLLGATVPVLVYLAARRGVGEREGIVAGGIAAVYLPSIFYEGLLLKSWMDVFLVAVAIAFLAAAIARSSRETWAAAGLVLGVVGLDRGNFILVVPALAAWLVLDPGSDRSRSGIRSRLAYATALLAGAGLVLGASAVRNRIAGGEWILTTAQAGQNFYLGNNPWSISGEYDAPPFLRTNPEHEEDDFAAEARRRSGREMTPAERSSFWLAEGVGWIRQNPGEWAGQTARKLRSYFGAYEVPDNIDFYTYRRTAPILRLPLPGFGTVVPLALVGAWLAWPLGGWPRSLVVVLAIYVASVVLFFVLARYRLAAMPAMFALAGIGAVAIGDRLLRAVRGEARAPLVSILLGWAACAAVVNLPVRLPADDPLFRLASFAGLPTRAAAEGTDHYNLGLTYAKEGDLDRAEAELRRALAEQPAQATVVVELGKVLARAGRTDEAIGMFERAVALEPANPVLFHTLGLLYRRAGSQDDADAAFREEARLRAAR
jgi:tetratricopeptide (TPR) repeat protein